MGRNNVVEHEKLIWKFPLSALRYFYGRDFCIKQLEFARLPAHPSQVSHEMFAPSDLDKQQEKLSNYIVCHFAFHI